MTALTQFQRLEATGIRKVVIGVSGGLDSTLALLVAVDTFDRLGLPRNQILAYTMPGFATGGASLRRAHELMDSLGVSGTELDIRPSCEQMLADLDHPYSRGEKVFDVTFENVQAGERTSHLFRLANQNKAFVLGTGDLSELALGWCTFGVGDQMSHYAVNAGVPKTLIQHLIRWVVSSRQFDAVVGETLEAILDTAGEHDQLRAIAIWRGGEVAARGYGGFTPDRPTNIKSASKSVISALAGIAIARGVIAGAEAP